MTTATWPFALRNLAIFIILLMRINQASASPVPVYFWGIEVRDLTSKACQWDSDLQAQVKERIRDVDVQIQDTKARTVAGCTGHACATEWPGSRSEGTVIGGFIEKRADGTERARLWRYDLASSPSTMLRLRDLPPKPKQPALQLGNALKTLLESSDPAGPERARPTYCGDRGIEDCADFISTCPSPTAQAQAQAQAVARLGPNPATTARKVLTFVAAGLAVPVIALSFWGLSLHGQPNESAMDCRVVDPATGTSRTLFGGSCYYATRDLSIAGLVLGFGALPALAAGIWPYSENSQAAPTGPSAASSGLSLSVAWPTTTAH
jgi:hypothetical protein